MLASGGGLLELHLRVRNSVGVAEREKRSIIASHRLKTLEKEVKPFCCDAFREREKRL